MNMTNFPVSYLFDVDQSGAVGGVLHWLQLDVQSRTLATGDVEGGEAVVLAALDARSRVPLLADVAAQLEPAHITNQHHSHFIMQIHTETKRYSPAALLYHFVTLTNHCMKGKS